MISDDDMRMLDRATESFGRILSRPGAIGPRPSRCAEWSTREVANHVLGGAIRYAHYFSGGDPAEIAWSRTADHLGDDAPAAHRELASALRDQLDRHRDDGIVLHHPIQDVDATTLLVLRVQELVLHGWDIASAAEPSVELDPQLCAFLLERGEPVRAMLREAGSLATPATPVDDSPTARVLAACGRR